MTHASFCYCGLSSVRESISTDDPLFCPTVNNGIPYPD